MFPDTNGMLDSQLSILGKEFEVFAWYHWLPETVGDPIDKVDKEILHQLLYMKSHETLDWDILHINWSRTSSINSILQWYSCTSLYSQTSVDRKILQQWKKQTPGN